MSDHAPKKRRRNELKKQVRYDKAGNRWQGLKNRWGYARFAERKVKSTPTC